MPTSPTKDRFQVGNSYQAFAKPNYETNQLLDEQEQVKASKEAKKQELVTTKAQEERGRACERIFAELDADPPGQEEILAAQEKFGFTRDVGSDEDEREDRLFKLAGFKEGRSEGRQERHEMGKKMKNDEKLRKKLGDKEFRKKVGLGGESKWK